MSFAQVDQDPLGKQGARISQTHQPAGGMAEIWTRQLVNHEYAILFFNRNNSAPLDITCDATCLDSMGFKPGEFNARDLNRHADIDLSVDKSEDTADSGSARAHSRHGVSQLGVQWLEKDNSVMMRLTPKSC